jgi:DHA1 family bicyclomycin/chloramphenicol resistance-like MFS transporter
VRDANALRPRVLARTAGGILGNGSFWAFALLSACSFGGLFCFLSASSYVFIRILGVAPRYYGVVLLVMMIFYIKGTVLCRYLILHGGVVRALRIGGLFSLCGGGLMAGLALAGVSNVWAILIPACIFNVGHGINQPCGQSGAVAPFPRVAGAASALSGCLMMLVAFASGSLVGALMDGTALPMVLGVGGWSVAVAAVAWGWVPRLGRA